MTPRVRSERLSEHFWASEFACRHCGRVFKPKAAATDLIAGLEQIRSVLSEFLGQDCPIVPTSGYRCPDHSLSKKRRAAGQRPSKHTLGLAADITADVPLEALACAALGADFFRQGGVGIYPQDNFVHVDVRPDGPARWGVLEGVMVSWREAVETLLP